MLGSHYGNKRYSPRVLRLSALALVFTVGSVLPVARGAIVVDFPNINGGAARLNDSKYDDYHLADSFGISVSRSMFSASASYSVSLSLEEHFSFPAIIGLVANGTVVNDFEVQQVRDFDAGVNVKLIPTEEYRFKKIVVDSFSTSSTSATGDLGASISLIPIDDFTVTYTERDDTGGVIGSSSVVIEVDVQQQLALLTNVPEPSTSLLAAMAVFASCLRRRRQP